MHKGDIVTVYAIVETRYACCLGELIHKPNAHGDPIDVKGLYRHQVKPWKGIVVGYTWRATGHYNWDTQSLMVDKRHKVWLVQPLGNDRWYKPAACLKEDLTTCCHCGTMITV